MFNLHDIRIGHRDAVEGEVIVFTELTGIVNGVAECTITDKRMMIDYFHIGEAFRRQELGSLLLDETIAFARSKGMRELWGSLLPSHDTPWLRAWLTKHGFELHPPTPENAQSATASFRILL